MRDVEAEAGSSRSSSRRLLHERLGEHDELLLAAGELREAALGQLGDAEPPSAAAVAPAASVLAAAVGAHLDDLAHGEVEVEVEVLRHERDLAGHVAALVLRASACR